MDPDEALRIIRALIRQLEIEDPGPPQEAPAFVQHARDLAQYVVALDEWLSKGGFPPGDWSHRGPLPEFIYAPTRERVRILGIANEGQLRPEDPGHGQRLYAVRFLPTGAGQASVGELRTIIDGKERMFRPEHWWPTGSRSGKD